MCTVYTVKMGVIRGGGKVYLDCYHVMLGDHRGRDKKGLGVFAWPWWIFYHTGLNK